MSLLKKAKEEVKSERKPRTVDNDNRRVYFMSGKKNDKTVPKILLEGNWLNEFGFTVGTHYKLEGVKDKITLTINK